MRCFTIAFPINYPKETEQNERASPTVGESLLTSLADRRAKPRGHYVPVCCNFLLRGVARFLIPLFGHQAPYICTEIDRSRRTCFLPAFMPRENCYLAGFNVSSSVCFFDGESRTWHRKIMPSREKGHALRHIEDVIRIFFSRLMR